MASDQQKLETPPYISYSTFSNFIQGLAGKGVPSRIDKSILTTMSGSGQASLLASMKWLGLIDQVGVPQPTLETLVHADEQKYSQVWAEIMRSKYTFLTDGSIDLTKATGAQVEQKFREFGIQGSTVLKSMAFFIAACKDAKIVLGPHVKAPKASSSGSSKRNQSRKAAASGQAEDEVRDKGSIPPMEQEGFVKIHIPLHGMADGAVFLPDNLTPEQWAYALRITKFLLDNYRADAPAS